MKLKLSGLPIAALTAALSFPVAAAADAVSPTTLTDASSSGAKDQPTKMAMKCGKKYDMKKRNGKDCEDCDGNCGANCFKK